MPLILGLPLTLLALWIASLLPAFGHTLVWPATAVAALWVYHDAREHQLVRYERVFPLDPAGAALAVLLAAPISFPWFLRLRWMALRGDLKESHGRSRAKFVLLGIAALLGIAVVIAFKVLAQSQPMKRALAGASKMREVTGGEVRVDLPGTVTLTLPATRLDGLTDRAREDSAKALAETALTAFDSTFVLTRVIVVSAPPPDPGWVQFRQLDPSYSWTVAELKTARDKERSD